MPSPCPPACLFVIDPVIDPLSTPRLSDYPACSRIPACLTLLPVPDPRLFDYPACSRIPFLDTLLDNDPSYR